MNAFGGFGQRAAAPAMLGSFVDDLENDLQAKAQTFATSMANSAYDQVHERFNQDRDELVGSIVDAAKPRVLALLDDAEAKARIGAVRNQMIVALGVTATLTILGTWAAVRYIK